MTEPGAEFVTVAEAARRLGISERQARRDAAYLSGDDRLMSGKGPTRVRLTALAAVRNHPFPSLDDSGTAPDTRPPSSGDDRQGADTQAAVLVEQLRAENAYLRSALERSQTLQLQMLSALNAEQQRARELEHLQARLIEALPAPQAPTGNGPGAPESAPTGESGQCAQPAENDSQDGKPRRAWWQWWRRKEEV